MVQVLVVLWITLGSHRDTLAAPNNVPMALMLAIQPISPKLEPPLITPLEVTTVELLTHTADFTLLLSEGTNLAVELDATYRLENSSNSPVTVILQIADTKSSGVLDEITLSADDIPLTLFQTEGIGYTAQLQINADTRTNVRLRYRLTAADLLLPLFSYKAAELAVWPGNPSVRVSIAMPEAVDPDSWLHLAPKGWRYGTVNDEVGAAGLFGVKWLYDAQLPQAPFLFEFIHPHEWAQLQQLATQASADAAAYLQLGNRYRSLLDATPLTMGYAAVRERFYAQTLAAYSTGIDLLTVSERTDPSLGALYAALASLYRTQVAQPNGTVDTDYATAMVDAAQQAITQLPTDDSRHQELAQWVADGLQIGLSHAQTVEDWPVALQAIEQLSLLPPALVNHDILAQTKRSITVRQALQLLEEENRVGAVAVAGEDLINQALLPALEQLPLFRRWEISATITSEQINVTITPIEVESRTDAATTAFTEFAARLQSSADSSTTVQWQPTDGGDRSGNLKTRRKKAEGIGQLLITSPMNASFASLTTAIPPIPQWALLYTLLRQLQPTMHTQADQLNQTTQLHLPLDFRAAGDKWLTVAATLEATASELEAEAATRNTRDTVEAESALQLRIQAANYRTSAQEWRRLMRDSWVAIQLTVPAGLQETTQTWLMTTASPATLLTLQSAPSYAASFMGALALGITVLLFLSGLLWWLL